MADLPCGLSRALLLLAALLTLSWGLIEPSRLLTYGLRVLPALWTTRTAPTPTAVGPAPSTDDALELHGDLLLHLIEFSTLVGRR